MVERNKAPYRDWKTAVPGPSPPSTALRWAAASSSAWPGNHRIVVDAPHAVVGLPEVTLGLLRVPRCVRLTALIGLDKAVAVAAGRQAVAPGRSG